MSVGRFIPPTRNFTQIETNIETLKKVIKYLESMESKLILKLNETNSYTDSAISDVEDSVTEVSEAIPETLDDIEDGETYARILAAALSEGAVLLSQASGTLDDIADGTTYSKILGTSLSDGIVLLSAASGTLDDITDGAINGKVLLADLDGGHIILGSCSGDLDDIADGSTYGKVAVTDISSGHILLASCSGTLDDVDDGASFGKVALTDISSGHILLASCSGDLDDISNGTSYGKVLLTDISEGHILLSECSGDLDDVSDGTTYGKVAITDISSGHILLASCSGDLDDITDGSSYGKVSLTDIDSGHIKLATCTGSLDDIADGSSYGKIAVTDISAGHILLSACSGDLDDISDGTNYGRVSSTYISAGKILLTGVDGAGGLAALNDIDLSYITDAGALAALNNIDLSYVTDAGALAALDSVGVGDISGLGALAELDEVGWRNMIHNSHLDMWSSGGSAAPDGFYTSGSPTITRESSVIPAWVTYSAKIVAGVSAGYLYWRTTSAYLKGATVSLSVWAYADTPNTVRAKISDTDGVNTSELYSEYHPGDSAWHLLTVDGFTSQGDMTYLYFGVECVAGATGYMAQPDAVEGPRAPRFTAPYVWFNTSSSGTGLKFSGSYLGFYRNDGYRGYWDVNGNFVLRTDSGAYAFRYYGTTSGSYGEGDLFIGSSTAGEGSMWWDQSAKYFVLDGTFRGINGCDIKLFGADSNQAQLQLHCESDGSGYYGALYGVNTGDWIYFLPQGTSVDGNLSFRMGNSAYTWKVIEFNGIDINLIASTDVKMDTPLVSPTSAGGTDLGTNTAYWGTLECVTLDDSHDVSFLDDRDDLGDMMKVSGLVDEKGVPVIDPHTGNQIVDDSTLPDYVCAKWDDDMPERAIVARDGKVYQMPAAKKGEVVIQHDGKTRGNLSAWKGWLLGGIKQLKRESDARYLELVDRISALEESARSLQ